MKRCAQPFWDSHVCESVKVQCIPGMGQQPACQPRPTRSDTLVSDARTSFADFACHHCGRDCREAEEGGFPGGRETARGVSGGAGVTCHGCWQRFCALCSTLNYDAREDRAFCLDCEAARRADAAAGHPRCGAPGGRTHHDASVWGY